MSAPLSRASLRALPKAHLHTHFTGSMRPHTVRDLAETHGLRLPPALATQPRELQNSRHTQWTGPRGWFRFQRLYDAARACVRTEADMQRVVREAAHDNAAAGVRWLELQIDPTTYAERVGGLSKAMDIVCSAARDVTLVGPCGVGVQVAASRVRHPLVARTLARLARQYADQGPGSVVAFGLSNDERRGETAQFAPAFNIARRAGLQLAPHAGELLGADHVEQVLNHLRPHRLGHGVRAVEDPAVLERAVREDITFEVCPGSNASLGVYSSVKDVPLGALRAAGARIALGADDPLLFGSDIVDQYDVAQRYHGARPADLASLARDSLQASTADRETIGQALADVDTWLDSMKPHEEPPAASMSEPRT